MSVAGVRSAPIRAARPHTVPFISQAPLTRPVIKRPTPVLVRAQPSTQERAAELEELRYRRHFDESDPPDESSGPQAALQRAKDLVRPLPIGLSDIAIPLIGAAGAYALNDAHTAGSAAIGLALGGAARLLQVLLLESEVPFTRRKHTLLLPVDAELAMGSRSYEQVLNQPNYKGKVLPADHPDAKLVQKIAKRIIEAVDEGHGGGFQDHIKKFDWEVAVIQDDTPNAFVLPGGKIVVFTGILDLLNRNEDMVGTVLGHEAAHALARHSGEKLTLGLAVTAGLQLLALFFGSRGGRGGQQQSPYGYGGRQQNPYGQNPYGRGAPGPYGRGGFPGGYPQRGGRGGWGGPRYFGAVDAVGSTANMLGPSSVAGPLGAILNNPRLVNIAQQLLLQLPFSRRAEAEADLIGLKLMSLAGYNPDLASKTFLLLEEFSQGGGGKPSQGRVGVGKTNEGRQGGPNLPSRVPKGSPPKIPSVLTTHPRSQRRAELLEQELKRMREIGDRRGSEVVLSKVPYWML